MLLCVREVSLGLRPTSDTATSREPNTMPVPLAGALRVALRPRVSSPDGYSLDNLYLARPGADAIQLDLFGNYKNNVTLTRRGADRADRAASRPRD